MPKVDVAHPVVSVHGVLQCPIFALGDPEDVPRDVFGLPAPRPGCVPKGGRSTVP